MAALPLTVAAQTITASDAAPDASDVTVSGDIDSTAKAHEAAKRQDDPPRQQQIYIRAPTDKGEGEERPWWWWLRPVADAATVISTLILAGAGIYGLLFLRAQVAAMEESNRQTQISNQLTRDSNEAALRAFRHEARARVMALGFRTSGKHPVFNDGTYNTVTITVQNTGNSDAQVTVRGEIGFSKLLAHHLPDEFVDIADIIQRTSDTPPYLKFEELPPSGFVGDVTLRRGETREFHLDRDEFLDSEPPELEAFRLLAVHAHVAGCILTRDELGETRYTYICATINVAVGGRVLNPQTPDFQEWTWTPCWNNNREMHEQHEQEPAHQ